MKSNNNNNIYSSPIKQLDSRYQKSISNNPANFNAKANNNSEKYQSYPQTPAKNMAEQEFYKLKAMRLQQQNLELKAQNKKLKETNHQLLLQSDTVSHQLESLKSQNYRKQMPIIPPLNIDKGQSTIRPSQISNSQIQGDNLNVTNRANTVQIQKLLKEIRMLKNNHQLEINNFQELNKKLRKKVTELEQKRSTQSRYQQNPLQIDCNTLKLQKIQLNQLLNRHKEENMSLSSQIQILKNKIYALNQQLNKKRENQTQLIQNQVENIRKSRSLKLDIQTLKYSNEKIIDKHHQGTIPEDSMENQQSEIKILIQQPSSYRSQSPHLKDRFKQNHSPPQSDDQQILRLKNIVKAQRLDHECKQLQTKSTIQNLKYKIQRLQKVISEKENQINQILTKLKPLLTKQRPQFLQKSSKKLNIEKAVDARPSLTLLQVYLQRHRMLN